MGRLLYLIVGNVAGVILGLLIGAISLIVAGFTSLKITVVIGVAVLIYVICFIVGIVGAIKDPFEMDS